LPIPVAFAVRNSTIDLLKALASQIIVVHHLLLYTPMSPVLQAKWPGLLGLSPTRVAMWCKFF